MRKHILAAGIAGALTAGSVIALPGMASASAPTSFPQKQQQLEQQLSNRVSQLSRLTADVNGSTSLSAAHKSVLSARLSTEASNINALVTKVPTDTTMAQLNADRQAMLRDNRVFAVETPQVIEIIEADSIAAQVTTMQGDESTLQASINSLSGQPGYENALDHYNAFVSAVGRASAASGRVVASVLPQTPQDFPGDTHIFVSANRSLLAADIALAHATYDESVIGLASGGYTGP
jgi:hypothetical protein